jgi:hypothetical protein
MKSFWTLFKKEFRFLIGPGIALFFVLYPFSIFGYIIVDNLFPGFYYDNILRQADHSTMFYTFFIRPIMLGNATVYIYAMLFLYSVLFEHIARTRYQLFIIPVRRMTHIAAKFVAVAVWVIVNLIAALVISCLSGMAKVSFEVVVLGVAENISNTLLICAIAMLSYVMAISVRRWRYLVGIVTFIAGYLFVGRMYVIVSQYIARHSGSLHYSDGIPILLHMVVWKLSISNSIVAFLFLTSAFMLYERTSEV